jgi:hypothetical protein
MRKIPDVGVAESYDKMKGVVVDFVIIDLV